LEKLEIAPKKFIQLRCAGTTRASMYVPLGRVGRYHPSECVGTTRASGQIDLARSVMYPPLGVWWYTSLGTEVLPRSELTSRIGRY